MEETTCRSCPSEACPPKRRVRIMLTTRNWRDEEGGTDADTEDGRAEQDSLIGRSGQDHVVLELGETQSKSVDSIKEDVIPLGAQPTRHRPLVKTLSAGTKNKKFTVVNYGAVEAGNPSPVWPETENTDVEEAASHGKEQRGRRPRRGSLYTDAILPKSKEKRSLSLDRKPGSLENKTTYHGERRGSLFKERGEPNGMCGVSSSRPGTPHKNSLDFMVTNGFVKSDQSISASRPSLEVVSNIDLRLPRVNTDPNSLSQSSLTKPTRNPDKRRPSLAQSHFRSRHSISSAIDEYEENYGGFDRNFNRSLKIGGMALPMPMVNLNNSSDTLDGSASVVTKTWHQKVISSFIDVARRGRLFAQRKRARLISKDGDCNVQYLNLEHRGNIFLNDIFTSVLNMKWRWNLILFTLAFLLTWVLLALIWWALVAVMWDPDTETSKCIIGVVDFKSALLFSIETQATIGYGTRAITDQCPVGFFLVMFQTILNVFLCCICSGIMFAKVARPKRRANAFIFSKIAVINQMDGELCLIFRVGDQRMSQMIGVNINALLVCTKITDEGEIVDVHQTPLKISTLSNSQFYFLAWPVWVIHKIDKDSPFWDISAEELILQEFEVIIILDATCETTGMTTQVRTSYLPSELLWGYRLAPLAINKTWGGEYTIDFQHFHDTLPVETPEMSAKQMAEEKAMGGFDVRKQRANTQVSIGNTLGLMT